MTLPSKPNNLAIIPARAGSKGLPLKNIKLLNAKPMLAYSIEAALQSQCFNKVIVSTDDQNIAAVAKQYGAETPFIRPNHLANDTAMSTDVVLHAIEFFATNNLFFDTVSLLQPTSPLRTAEDITQAMKLFIQLEADSIISVCEAEHSPLWMNTLPESKSLTNFLSKEVLNKRRQDLPVYYQLNGAIYIVKTELLKKHKSFYAEKSYAYVMPRWRSIDVDHAMDFHLCETILNNRDNYATHTG